MKRIFFEEGETVNQIFLLRIASIERHIEVARREINYDMLHAARKRIEWEYNFNVSDVKECILEQLSFLAELAEFSMRNKLEQECLY